MTRRSLGTRPFGARPRRGIALIELCVALVILTVAMVGMQKYILQFTRAVTESGSRSTASDLAADRLEVIKGYGSYATLETAYQGTETAIPGYPGFTRVTTIARVGGPTLSVDYKTVTVSVSGPKLTKPVRKTTIIPSL